MFYLYTMNIPVEYQILFASSILALFSILFKWVKDYRRNKPEEPQRLAMASIITGLIIIIPFLSLVGFILGLISLIVKKNKRLSKVAIVVNLITLLPWLAVLLFGA